MKTVFNIFTPISF